MSGDSAVLAAGGLSGEGPGSRSAVIRPVRAALVPGRGRLVTAGLAVVLPVVLLAALAAGAFPIGMRQAVAILASKAGLLLPWEFTETEAAVLWQVRAPRVLFGAMAGAGLALGGALMQALFRNPLADPALIGMSGGAALAAALVTVCGSALPGVGSANGMFALPAAAFAGGVAATGLVFRLSRVHGAARVEHMLLVGIAVNALAGAGIGILMLIANDAQLRDLAFWSFGSLGRSSWTAVAVLAGLTAPALLAAPRMASRLNAFLLGEPEAGHLGVRVEALKRTVVGLTCLSVAGAVAFAGVIGFVGLVAPHMVRVVCGPDYRVLLPASALLGASLLPMADLVSRTVAAPVELPIGLMTALLGAPVFLWLLAAGQPRRAV